MTKLTILGEGVHRIPCPEELTVDARHQQAAPLTELIDEAQTGTDITPADLPDMTPDTTTSWHAGELGIHQTPKRASN